MISFKRGLKNLFVVFIYGFIFFLGLRGQDYLVSAVSKTFRPLPLIIYQTIFPIVFGFLLGFIRIFEDKKKLGSWRYDWGNLIVVGTPSFLISILPLLVWIPPFNTTILTKLLFLGNTFKNMGLGFGIIFGYTLLGSFHKEVENITQSGV